MADGSAPEVAVMMNGLPGNMGKEVAAACLRRGFAIAPYALTGPGMPSTVEVDDGNGGSVTSVKLVPGGSPEADECAVEMNASLGDKLIVIDFTHPTAVNPNAEYYAKHGLAYIMGTTGGDRDKLMKDTTDANLYAVIAPNMCKQIVAFQATMESMATKFPGAFNGYSLEIVESHQEWKADTSGTAKAMVDHFQALGPDFKVEDIQMVRDPEQQKAMGVPEDALQGHAWHTYTLTSGDGSVKFAFTHNVCGRRTYAEGVADTVSFLASKISERSEKRVFNMIDVLEAGVMN
jgi:4-hydroxy-tetrahydrodipicolinate reductase